MNRDRIEADGGWPDHPEDVLDGYERYEQRQAVQRRAALPTGDPRNRGRTLRQQLGADQKDGRIDEEGYEW